MTTGWTGGQYSLLRVLLALGTTRLVLGSGAGALMHTIPLVLVILLAVGTRDRLASLGLAALVLGESAWSGAVLAVHAALPGAPYGSWDARGRTDPGGEWRMPDWVPLLAWGTISVGHLGTGIAAIGGGTPLFGLVELSLLALALAPPTRRWGWLGLTLFAITSGAPLGVLFVHAFAFDPGWIRPDSRIVPAIVFYDGACGLCHRAVRFLLAEDRAGVLQLAPLESPVFERLVSVDVRATLPDSLVVRGTDGQLFVRSRCVIEIGAALGGLWRAAAILLMLLPTEFADRAYDFVASVRRRLFAPPDAACPLVPVRLRARFLRDGDDEPAQSEASAAR
jgi:predicted DCC family thiol-disulfide oxidoreductase YuxK